MLNRVYTTDESYARLNQSVVPQQTDVLRGYLVARRRALLLESAHIERALLDLDKLQKGATVDCKTV